MIRVPSSPSGVRALLFAWLTVCSLLATAASSRAQQGVDVVFMVDTSGIVGDWDTADSSRLAVAHGVVEGLRNLGPARIGVLSLSGDAAAPAGGWVELPLTALPDDPAAVSAFLETKVHGVLSALGSDQPCLPLNVAVEKHLTRMLESRGDPGRPLWLVLLTHGEVDPVSPVGDDSWVTQDVRERTEEMTGLPYDEADRPEIRAAAKSLLLERFPAEVASLGDDVVLSVVDVNANSDPAKQGQREQAMSNGRPVDLLAQLSDEPLLTLDGHNVRTVVDSLLEQAPFPPRSGSPGIIVRDLSGAPTQRFRIYQGTSWARLSLVADHADFHATLTYVEGQAAPGFYDTSGADRSSRSLDLRRPTPGLIELSVTPNPGAAPLHLKAQLRFSLDLDVVAQVPADSGVLPVGSSLELKVQLRDNVGGGLISDAELLKDGRVTATWSPPSADDETDRWTPGPDETHTTSHLQGSTTNGSQSFAWVVEASLLKRADGGFDWTDQQAGQTQAEFATPALTMTFANGDDDVAYAERASGSSLTFAPEWISGSVTSQAILNVLVDLHGSGREVPLTLRFSPDPAYGPASADGSVSASFSLDGSPLAAGNPVIFTDGVSRALTVTVSKSGMPPYSGSLGSVIAELGDGDSPRAQARAQVALSMSPALGLVTIGSLIGLLLLLALLFLLIRKRLRESAYRDLIAGLGDAEVIYFHDDESGAPAHGASS